MNANPTAQPAEAAAPPSLRKTATPTEPQKPRRRASTWVPDARWAHPVELGCWLLALATVAWAAHLPAWAMAALAPIGAAIGVQRARRTWPGRDYGGELRQSMSWLAVIAAVAAAGWAVYAVATSPLTALGWLALGLAWLGGWYAHLRTGGAKVAQRIADNRAGAEAAQREREVAQATATWRDILAPAGLQVADIRPTRAGYVVGVEPVDPAKPVSFYTLQQSLPDLTTKAAALLAKDGVTLRAGMIRAEETEAAHVHLIHVGTRDVLTQSIPFDPIPEPTTIADPIDVGLYEDGQEVQLTLGGPEGGQNGKIVGASGSGKSVLTNCVVGRVGECVDAIVGIVASSKLVPLVYPWVKPWLAGEADRPGIDFAAGQSPQQVLVMLAAIWRLVCERNAHLSNRSVHEATNTAPNVVVIVEEAGKMATRTEKILTHDGRTVGFSTLVDMICSECRSAGVSVFLLNQSAILATLGDGGQGIERNTPVRVCLKTMAPQDGMATLPGLKASYSDTSKLRHHSMLVQPSVEEPRVMPAKSYRLDEDLVHPVAIRNAAWRPDLEPELVAVLGEAWTGRWDAVRLPELAAAARKDGLAWPVGEQLDDMDLELRKMIDDHGGQPAQDGQAEQQPDAAATPSGGEWPDQAEALDALRAAATQPPLTLPEPLAAVMKLLSEPGAPKDWVATQQLAILLDRVTIDAPAEERREAARKLGRELAALDDQIRTEQRDRQQGYDVPRLREIAARIARSGQ